MFRTFSNLHICLILLILTAALPDEGLAQLSGHGDALDMDNPGFSGEGGLGLIVNSGNSESENLSASLKLDYTTDSWDHEFSLDAKQTTAEDTTTAKRTLVNGKTSYTFSPRVYTFAALRYDRDRFSGFEYIASASAGLGWHLLNDDVNRLDLDVGVGGNVSKLQDGGTLEHDEIARLGLQFTSQLSPTTQFRQDLLVESSRLSTTSESRTGLKVAMNSKLALQVLYAVRKNSNPPEDTQPIDRHTAVGLIYAF